MCAQLTRTHGEAGVEQTASWLNADTGQDMNDNPILDHRRCGRNPGLKGQEVARVFI